MATVEKIVEFHISRLKDKNPEVRLKSIAELKALGASAISALEALEACHKNSEEAEVQKAAQKAGFSIFMASKKNGAQPSE